MSDSPATEDIHISEYADSDIQNLLMPEFDRAFYCDRYRDINTDVVNPLEHYCVFGWKEGRDPCAWFSTRRYMERHSDVANSGYNPFLHYVLLGKREGRRIWPADHHGAFDLDVDPESTLVTDIDLRALIKYPPRASGPPSTPLNTGHLKIHWVIPDFGIGSGGHMTIFRLIRWMEIAGHDCSLWITSPHQHRTASHALDDIVKHFQTIRAPVAFADDGFAEAEGDAVIATGWQTVARVLNATGFRQRFYLVQDFEPSFHPVGSHAIAAEWTYTQDLACICTSPWLVQILREKHGRWVRQFWQAYDKAIYYPIRQRSPRAEPTGDVPRIALYARRTSARRAVELAFLALEHLAARGVKFHVDLFGAEIVETVAPFPCSSHGVLSPAGLAELYRNACVGICFSATNYSLVPAEMMACGLPVIEVDGEATRAVFPDDVVALTGPHPCGIADGIEALLLDPGRRQRQIETALRWVDQFDWENSAKTVECALIERLSSPVGLNGTHVKPAGRSRKMAAGHLPHVSRSPKVSVCIPTYNGGKLLLQVVERVRSQRAPWPFEIIVVDSHSTDGSIRRLATTKACANGVPNLRVASIPKAEFQHGRTRNLCAGMARGEFVAFLTQDALPADDFWLYNLVTLLERFPGAAGAFGRHLPYASADPFTRRDIESHFDSLLKFPLLLSRASRLSGIEEGSQKARQVLHFFSDNNSCLRKSVWETVPYPEIDFGEDQAWADKIIQLDYEKVYVPAAAVYHSHNHTPGEIADRATTEAFFFATVFGYETYDFQKSFQDQLGPICESDIIWARKNGVSESELVQRLLENKARLYGRVMGMERARIAINAFNNLHHDKPVIECRESDRLPPPMAGAGHLNGVSAAKTL